VYDVGGFETYPYDDEPVDEPLENLQTPSLVLDLEILERNLRRMALRMRKLKVRMRPHFKTHRNLQIVEIQKELQAIGFTVSTLNEACSLANAGYRDITLAYPVIPHQVHTLDNLLRRARLRLLVDSHEAIDALEKELDLPDPIHVWLKVDCGYHRVGVDPQGHLALELAHRLDISEPFFFDGILSHSGHAYQGRGRESLAGYAEEERQVMVACAERLRASGIKVPRVSVGSTPAMSAVENLEGVTEVRPGNYVFYDYSQVEIGSCSVEDCALTVMSTVISSQPGAGHSVIDAGALTLSKDPGPSWVDPPTYGRIYRDYEAAELDPDLRIVSLSQEHGIVNGSFPVGTRLRILPNHSCLAMANFEIYNVVRGDRIVDYGCISVNAKD
jgi:D-serine deaminase-like pyridoxal phosphate-dependent protein